jgi:hypothetical protein
MSRRLALFFASFVAAGLLTLGCADLARFESWLAEGAGGITPSTGADDDASPTDSSPDDASADLDAPWGVNAHLPSAAELDLIAAAGIPWVRLSAGWHLLEPVQGTVFWDVVDQAVAAARARNLHIMMTIWGTPEWASDSGAVNAVPRDSADWAAFVTQFVTRYQDDIQHWGLWNEPNGGGGEYFAGTAAEFRTQILIPGANAAKAVDPSCKIVAAGITIHTGWEDWMRGVFGAGGAAAVDIISVHAYVLGDADDLFWIINERAVGDDDITPLANMLEALDLTDKPVWLTETGWPTSGDHAFSAADQARHIHGVLWRVHQGDLIDKVFLYDFIDDDASGLPVFGLVAADATLKPAYETVRDFIANPTAP